MKKKAIIIIATLFLGISSVFGQIIYTDEDATNNRTTTFGVMVPMQNTSIDQYKLEIVPLGGGLFLLAALSGGYLLKKKTGDRSKK